MKPSIALVLGSALALSACVTPPLSQLRAETMALRAQRSTVTVDSPALATELSKPLDADGAVRVALLNNPSVRATLAQLQSARGDLYAALHPANPVVEFSRMDGGGIRRTAWSVSQPLLDLLFASYRRQHGELAMREAQQQVADQLLRLERDVRQAWLASTTAELKLGVMQRAAEAAKLAAELAAQYHAAGNITESQWRSEESLAAEAQLKLAMREADAVRARTALLDLLGLKRTELMLRFNGRLMLPTALSFSADQLAATALQNRLDLAAMSAALEAAQREGRHLDRWRWLPGAELRFSSERETGQSTLNGPGLAVQLPLPDSGAGRSSYATATVEVRTANLAAAQLAVQNRIAEDAALLTIASRGFDEHARKLLQESQRLLALAGEQQNFMLIGSFDLLSARRRQIEAQELWVDAISRWWQVFNDLAYESGTALPTPVSTGHVSAENLP
jgi:outer membrane protein, heavy metal efflux system